MIHVWSSLNTLDNVKPIIGGSVPGYSFLSQYHTVSSKEQKSILIQSPLSCISYKNKDWIHFDISVEENQHSSFVHYLQKFISKIHKSIQKKYQKNIDWDHSIITKSPTTKSIHAKILKGCQTYDVYQNKLNDTNILEKNIADFIFSISQIRIVRHMDEENILYGKILFEIVQIRTHNTETVIPENCLFESPHLKYFDMLKKGVPRQAVEQRMNADGVDTNILDNHGKKLGITTSPIRKVSFTANDLKNTKLKKTTQNKKKTKPKLGIHLGISYEDIQNTLKGLRKTRLI